MGKMARRKTAHSAPFELCGETTAERLDNSAIFRGSLVNNLYASSQHRCIFLESIVTPHREGNTICRLLTGSFNLGGFPNR